MKPTVDKRFHRRTALLMLGMAVLLFCSACGSDYPPPEGGGGNSGYVEGPNAGSGWIGFSYPYGPLETTEPSVKMGGMTFIPATATCPHWTGDLGSGYRVTWFNDANSQSGQTLFGLNCLTIVFAWWQAPLGTIPLEAGVNRVTVTADDGLGNIGRATMTITRN